MKSTLENYGYRVLTAPNGLEAVACFETHKNEIRLLLTDTDMPYLNGMSVIRAVQKIDPGLPVVLASGTELNTEFLSSQTQILRLSKPYDVEQLLESVARALLMRKAVVKA